MVEPGGCRKYLDLTDGYLCGTSLARFHIMSPDVESDWLRRDLKHYRAELNTIKDPRDVKVLTDLIFAIAMRLDALEDRKLSRLWALSESEVWRAALRLIKRHGVSAPEVAGQHADALAKENHSEGAAAWRRILHAADELLRVKPKAGERTH